MNVAAKYPGGLSSAFATVFVSDAAEAVEVEPNDTADKASRVELGAQLNGRLDKAADVDRFIFTAKKDQNFTFTAVTRSAHAPSDLVMRLYKADGGKVSEADDNGTNDGTFNYAFPADGDYTLTVEDLSSRVKPVCVSRSGHASHSDVHAHRLKRQHQYRTRWHRNGDGQCRPPGLQRPDCREPRRSTGRSDRCTDRHRPGDEQRRLHRYDETGCRGKQDLPGSHRRLGEERRDDDSSHRHSQRRAWAQWNNMPRRRWYLPLAGWRRSAELRLYGAGDRRLRAELADIQSRRYAECRVH
jgi:hypothetical protein